MLAKNRKWIKKPWVKIYIFFIVTLIAYFGFFNDNSELLEPNAVAIVNGVTISQEMFKHFYERDKKSRGTYYRSMLKVDHGEKIYRERLLEDMVEDELIAQLPARLGLRISDSGLSDFIRAIKIQHEDGFLPPELLEEYLIEHGTNLKDFRHHNVKRLLKDQWMNGLIYTYFSLSGEGQSLYEFGWQARSGRALEVDSVRFNEGPEITEQQIINYYQNNLESFRIEEKISVDYIELSTVKLMTEQTISAEEIDNYYNKI